MPDPTEITRYLRRFGEGDREALDRVLPELYDELLSLARARLRGEGDGHTLDTAGLVHEAYLRLAELERIRWQDRNHFFSMASRLMRRVLVDHARKRQAEKRGGGRIRITLRDDHRAAEGRAATVLALDEALSGLEAEHPRAARALQHRYFAGCTNREIADLLETSERTVERDLRFARAWLAREWGAEGPA